MLLHQSCTKEPVAAFSYYPGFNPEAGESINFFNKSIDAKDYYWELGNGETSTEEAPSTIYQIPGEYSVSLTACRSSKCTECSMLIIINDPTILQILLLKPDRITPLSNCRMKVYGSEENLISDVNPLYNVKTDENGISTFMHLEEITYYVSAYQDIHTGEYVIWGSLPMLDLNAVNVFYGIATFFPNGSKKRASTTHSISIFEEQP